jgi:hypothetical protein
MTLKELGRFASRLPLNAPDMRRDDSVLAAALLSQCGKLSNAMSLLERDPADALAKDQAMKHGGAAMLVLVSILEHLDLDLEESVRAGELELR